MYNVGLAPTAKQIVDNDADLDVFFATIEADEAQLDWVERIEDWDLFKRDLKMVIDNRLHAIANPKPKRKVKKPRFQQPKGRNAGQIHKESLV